MGGDGGGRLLTCVPLKIFHLFPSLCCCSLHSLKEILLCSIVPQAYMFSNSIVPNSIVPMFSNSIVPKLTCSPIPLFQFQFQVPLFPKPTCSPSLHVLVFPMIFRFCSRVPIAKHALFPRNPWETLCHDGCSIIVSNKVNTSRSGSLRDYEESVSFGDSGHGYQTQLSASSPYCSLF